MKRNNRNPKCEQVAFTIIELLVVVSIIMLLAGMLFTAGVGALRQAKKNKAKADIKGLEIAFTHYYNEYGKWPSCADGSIIADWPSLYDVLIGNEAITTGLTCNGSPGSANPKKITFHTPMTQDTCAGTGGTYLKDPWGQAYNIFFDFNYDGKLESGGDTHGGFLATDNTGCAGTPVPPTTAINPPGWTTDTYVGTVYRGVVVWSDGPDKKNGWGVTNSADGTNYANGKDDITSWQ